jgi:hypothetical protein
MTLSFGDRNEGILMMCLDSVVKCTHNESSGTIGDAILLI